MVTLYEAWRKSSCTTFTSSPFAFSRVENVRLKVCQPIRFVIPAAVATGRIQDSMTQFGHRGCFPRFLPARLASVAKM